MEHLEFARNNKPSRDDSTENFDTDLATQLTLSPPVPLPVVDTDVSKSYTKKLKAMRL